MTRIQDEPRRRCLKVEEWPPQDRAEWRRAQMRADPFGDPGRAAHLRPASIEKIRKGYGRFLGFLRWHGLLDPKADPATRLREDWVRRYMGELEALGCAPWTVLGRLRELDAAVRIMAPEANRNWLRRAIARLGRRRPLGRDKRARLLSPRRVYGWALARMRALDAMDGPSGIHSAVCYRDALMIAWLAARPERRSTFANTHLERQLLRVGHGWRVERSPDEMKSGRRFDIGLPQSLVPFIDRYLAIYRPLLLRGRDNDAFWISLNGRPMSGQAVYHRVCRVTARAFGKPLNPHLFRDMLVTAMAIEDPVHIHASASLLDHTTLRASEAHYNQAQGLEAGRRINLGLQDLRRQARDLRRFQAAARGRQAVAITHDP